MNGGGQDGVGTSLDPAAPRAEAADGAPEVGWPRDPRPEAGDARPVALAAAGPDTLGPEPPRMTVIDPGHSPRAARSRAQLPLGPLRRPGAAGRRAARALGAAPEPSARGRQVPLPDRRHRARAHRRALRLPGAEGRERRCGASSRPRRPRCRRCSWWTRAVSSETLDRLAQFQEKVLQLVLDPVLPPLERVSRLQGLGVTLSDESARALAAPAARGASCAISAPGCTISPPPVSCPRSRTG